MFKVAKIEKYKVFEIEIEQGGETHLLKFTMERPKLNEFYELMSDSTISLAIARSNGEDVSSSAAVEAMSSATAYTMSKIKKLEGIELEGGGQLKRDEYEYAIPFSAIQSLTTKYIPWATGCLIGTDGQDKKKESSSNDSSDSLEAV